MEPDTTTHLNTPNAILQSCKPYVPVHAAVVEMGDAHVASHKNGRVCTRLSVATESDDVQDVKCNDHVQTKPMHTGQIAKEISHEYLRSVLKTVRESKIPRSMKTVAESKHPQHETHLFGMLQKIRELRKSSQTSPCNASRKQSMQKSFPTSVNAPSMIQDHLHELHMGSMDHKRRIEDLHKGRKNHQTHIEKLSQGSIAQKEHIEQLARGSMAQKEHMEELLCGSMDHNTNIENLARGSMDHKTH